MTPSRSIEFVDSSSAVVLEHIVVISRPNRDHCSIRGETYTPSTFFIRIIAHNIRSQLTPTRSIEFVDTSPAFSGVGISRSPATYVVSIRPNSNRGSVRGETYTISTFFIGLCPQNIRPQLTPTRPIKFVDTSPAFECVGCSCRAAADVVTNRPNRDRRSIRGETYTISTVFILLRPQYIRSQLTPTRSIEFEDAGATFYCIGIPGRPATDIVTFPSNRNRHSVSGETYTPSVSFNLLNARNIQTHLFPFRVNILVHSDAAFFCVGAPRRPSGTVVSIRPNRNHPSIRGETYTPPTLFVILRPRNIQPQLPPGCSIMFEDTDAAFVCVG